MFRVRALASQQPARSAEVARVAEGMRQTLIHVLGQTRGEAMYDIDWLRDRVRQHLDPEVYTAAVFVASRTNADDSAVIGHTIVRLDHYQGAPVCLFSTTWVWPEARRSGVASALLEAGERWMRTQGVTRALTWTAAHNTGLIRLFEGRGYVQFPAPNHESTDRMVGLLSEHPACA